MNAFDQMREAVRQGDYANRAVDDNVCEMVKLIKNRLKASTSNMTYATAEALKELKRELRSFDSRTGQWSDR